MTVIPDARRFAGAVTPPGLHDWNGVQRFALELTSPRGDLDANNRIYRAYTGLKYEIWALCVGGVYPYLFELSNAPAGMTVGAFDGKITWTNPTSNATPTIKVTDTKGSNTSQTWTIVVGTSGYRFIDPASGVDSGAGGVGAPWATMGYARSNAGANDILYLRGGTYHVFTTFGSFINSGTSRYSADFTGQPGIWLAYPGESPVFDFDYDGSATTDQFPRPCIGRGGDNTWLDGIEMKNTHHFFFIAAGAPTSGPIYKDLYLHTHNYGWVQTESNASMLMFEHSTPQMYGASIVNCHMTDGGLAIKHYDLVKSLIHGCHFHDMLSAIEEKAGLTRFTCRKNNIHDLYQPTGVSTNASYAPLGIGGNYNSETYEVSGEICFNLIRMLDETQDACYFPRDGLADGRPPISGIHGYRNTFVGNFAMLSIASDSIWGTFHVDNNVVVNPRTDDAEHIEYSGVTDFTKIVITNHLAGFDSDNIVDSNGNLQGTYVTQYLYDRGYQTP